MPGSSACAGVGVLGGRQARTVLSASDRAWRRAAPGPSSSHSRMWMLFVGGRAYAGRDGDLQESC
jgi:hypothetical protein